MSKKDLLSHLLGSAKVRYYPVLGKYFGVKSGVMLSQLLYWGPKEWKGHKAWSEFHISVDDMQEQTGLNAQEQRTARKKLLSTEAIQAKLRGVPPIWHYKLDPKQVEISLNNQIQLSTFSTFEDVESPQSNTEFLDKLNGKHILEHKLIDDDDTDPQNPEEKNPFKLWEQVTGKHITVFIADSLNGLIDEWDLPENSEGANHPIGTAAVCEAIKIMAEHSITPNFAYLETIVNNWIINGYKAEKPKPKKRTGKPKLDMDEINRKEKAAIAAANEPV